MWLIKKTGYIVLLDEIFFDQNISYRILQKLPDQLKHSTHVKNENLINAPDSKIWEFAKQYGYIIVTQDSDFNDLNSLYGFPPKVIWIRAGNMTTSSIVDLLIEYFNDIVLFENNSDYGCFEIVNSKK